MELKYQAFHYGSETKMDDLLVMVKKGLWKQEDVRKQAIGGENK